MHDRKRLLASIALVGVMLVTLACSHGESTGDLLNGGQKTGSAGQQAATATPRSPKGSDGPAASASATGGTLRLVGGLPPTLDPAMAQDSTSAEYIVHLFSGLVRLNGDLVVIPDLAANWTVSDDGRVYTFTLRDDARFADGRALTSADVVYSIERACSPATGSPVAASYLSDIVGVPEYATGAAASIDGLRAPSSRTVELTIDAPKAYFLAKLTYTASFVVDREQVETGSDGWMRQPNGSGPFVLAEMSQEHIVLERNENYYGTRPALDRVEYIVAGGFPVTMYENDELDIVDVPPSEMERIADPENPLHDELRVASELSISYLGFNVEQAPFDDLAVRQAFAMAIDKERIADLVFQGTGTPAAGILPPGLPDYDASFAGLPYDPARARALLLTSKYGAEGAMPPVVLAVSGTSGYLDSVTEAVLSLIEDNLGMSPTVQQVDWTDFLRDMNAHRYPMYLTGWIADYPDSENFLDLLFHSSSPQNHMDYASSTVDALLERARVEENAEERTRLYREAEQQIVSDAPWIPLVHGLRVSLVKPDVQGYASTAAIYPWLQDVYLER